MTRRTASLVALALCLDALLLYLPPGLSSLDARLCYAPSEAFAFLGSLGPEGRRAYAVHELFDLAFIVTYTALGRRLGIARTPLFCMAAADAVETASILALLVAYPATPTALAAIVAVATPLKWIALAAAVLGLVVRRIRR
jgi:hypothetical protein